MSYKRADIETAAGWAAIVVMAIIGAVLAMAVVGFMCLFG